MEHQVRVVDLVVGPDEAAALEMIGGCRPLPGQDPLQTDERLSPFLEIGLHRDRFGAGVLDVDLEVVLQIGAHPG